MATLARRLRDLGLVEPAKENEIRQARTNREDFERFGLVNSDELKSGRIPQSYREAVESLYLEEEISEDRALELLRGSATFWDLPELPELMEQDLWSLV